jgi:hypothetical protein
MAQVLGNENRTAPSARTRPNERDQIERLLVDGGSAEPAPDRRRDRETDRTNTPVATCHQQPLNKTADDQFHDIMTLRGCRVFLSFNINQSNERTGVARAGHSPAFQVSPIFDLKNAV